MYVLLVNEDNTISTTKRERIMQRSKCVDNLMFLVSPIYKEIDMANATVTLEYLKPVSHRYKTEILVLSDEMYKDHLKYILPFDTELTDEAGSIEMQLTFTLVDLDADGKEYQYVRKTSKTVVPIVPITAWSDIIPDSALSALDQRLIKLDAQTKGLEAYAEYLSQTQVDNLRYDDISETLQLTSNGNTVGDKVSVRDMLDDGIPVIDLDSPSGDDDVDNNNCNCGCEDNVVEFGYSEPESDVPSKEDKDNNVVEF